MSAANPKTQDPSMDEILASIRRIIADDQDAPKSAQSGHLELPEDEGEDVLDLAEMPGSRLAAPADLPADVADISFQSAPGPFALSETAPPPRVELPPRASEASARPEPTPFPDREPLVSRETTASVSQAFNILSHTILTQNSRTLEDLVGEMLKPMLKVWLDDNLPPLVERLVRAEIERVARGSR